MSRSAPPRYGAGVAASVVADAVFVGIAALLAMFRGMDPWASTRMPASFALGPAAVEPAGFAPADVLLGALVHGWFAVLVGVLYAALLPRLKLSPTVGGLIAGVILYVLGFVVLPLLFPTWLAPFRLPPTEQALEAGLHLVYGLVFGAVFRELVRRGTVRTSSTPHRFAKVP